MAEAQACQSNGDDGGDTEQHNASEENTCLFHLLVDVVTLRQEMKEQFMQMYQNECERRTKKGKCKKRGKHHYLEVATEIAPDLADINETIKKTDAESNQFEHQ